MYCVLHGPSANGDLGASCGARALLAILQRSLPNSMIFNSNKCTYGTYVRTYEHEKEEVDVFAVERSFFII